MTSKTILGAAIGFVMAVSPFAAPFAFAEVATTTTTTTTASAATITAVVQSASSMRTTLQAQIAQLLQQIKALQAQIAQIKTTQQTITKSFAALRSQMHRGSRGRGVKVLQRLLASDPSIYPQGLVTGYYGHLTEDAVKKFQENHGISPVGEVGPETRMLMNSFLKHATSTIPMNFLRKIENEQESATSTDRMVIVCHRAGNSGIDISERIARRALFFHVKHGDSIGKCEREGWRSKNSSEQWSHNSERGDKSEHGWKNNAIATSTGDSDNGTVGESASSTSDGQSTTVGGDN